MAFVVNIMCVSILFHASNRDIIKLYLFLILLLYLGLPFFQSSTAVLAGHYINLTVFLFFCWLASRILYKNKYITYYHETLLTRMNNDLALKAEENKKMYTELATVNKKLKQLTIMDELTQIPNRRGFSDFCLQHIQQKKNGRKFSILMIDIDSFKQYNDNYGHLEGDVVLQAVAQTINQLIDQSTSFLARFGGEEFVITLVDKSEQEASSFAESIRLAVYNMNIIHKFSSVEDVVTVSIGLVTADVKSEEAMNEILRNADAALYQAKVNGRNRIEVYQLSETPEIIA